MLLHTSSFCFARVKTVLILNRRFWAYLVAKWGGVMEGSFKNGGAFVLTAVGAAVGLGNLFRFPALACRYGGGFVITYLLLALLLGLPLFLCETALGRVSGGTGAFGKGKGAFLTSWLCGANALLILPVYLLLTSFVIRTAAYLPRGNSADGIPSRLIFFCLVFALTLWLFFRGRLSGFCQVTGVALSCGGVFLVAICFLFKGPSDMLALLEIRPSAFLSLHFWRDVTGQVFFSLSVMTGVLTVFGEGLQKGTNLPLCALWVVLTDFAVSLAATVIYAGVEGDKSGLLSAFRVYPAAFRLLFGSFGNFAAFIFFVCLGLLCVDSVLAYMQSVFSLLAKKRVENFVPFVLAAAFFGVGLALQGDLFALTFLDSAVIPVFTLLVGIFEGVAISRAVESGLLSRSGRRGEGRLLGFFFAFLLPVCFFGLIILEIFT